MARKLFIPVPDRPLDHRNRFDGWQNDERWRVNTAVWKDSEYDIFDRPEASKGARPIAAFVGGDHDQLAVQFVERGGAIVGKYRMIYALCILYRIFV